MTNSGSSILLTGIKPTGQPHIGNYFGAIEPALRRQHDYAQTFLFIADYHALNTIHSAEQLRQQTLEVAATWLAAGLDPSTVNIYRQSDITEEIELAILLGTVTPKGWMNKMHAYKAAVDKNRASSQPDDNDINMGLYTYPILMASDILLFNASHVPVGRDQIQHVEITRDIAARFNQEYAANVFTLPEYVLEEAAFELPGIDGRKMSKSYQNTIPLFKDRAGWSESVRKIVTDNEIHTSDSFRTTTLYKLFQAVAPDSQVEALVTDFVDQSIGWKDAKDRLIDALENRFKAMADKYAYFMAHQEEVDAILTAGAAKVRPLARQQLNAARQAAGLNPLF